MYHLYLQNVNGTPQLGPVSTSGYFIFGTTLALVMADGSQRSLNADMSPSTSYKVCSYYFYALFITPLRLLLHSHSLSLSIRLQGPQAGACPVVPFSLEGFEVSSCVPLMEALIGAYTFKPAPMSPQDALIGSHFIYFAHVRMRWSNSMQQFISWSVIVMKRRLNNKATGCSSGSPPTY